MTLLDTGSAVLQDFIRPDWKTAPRVQAWCTTRAGGVSAAPCGLEGGLPGGLNLGDQVGDDPGAVARNRAMLPVRPRWLQQVHGCRVLDLDAPPQAPGAQDAAADAAVTTLPNVACAVLVADCLPVLLADRAGRAVGAAHAGWRGLAAGVVEATVRAMRARAPDLDLVAWLGPCIGPQAFEVGPEVRAAFLDYDAQAQVAFRPGEGNRWWCDLPLLARQRLGVLGIEDVTGGHWCTASDARRFYSFRRDGRTGRQAAVVWIDVEQDS